MFHLTRGVMGSAALRLLTHPTARSVVSILALVAAWNLAAWWAHNPARLPGPGPVAAYAYHAMVHGTLLAALGITLARVAASFAISMVAGTLLGMLMGRSAAANALIDPWLIVALNLPVLVVIVLVYIWCGLTEPAAILAVAIAKIPTVAVTIREGARALDRELAEAAAIFRLRGLRLWRRLIVPQMAPYLAASARSGLSITWKIVLIVELIGRPSGMGFEINLLFQNFDVAGIMAYGLVFSVVMLVMEHGVLRGVERRVSAWR